MRLKEQLIVKAGTDNLFSACKALVRSAFPQCANPTKSRDLEGLARSVGVKLETTSSAVFDGMFQATSEGSTITLSTLKGRARTRFTLAHELAHWMLRECKATHQVVAFRGVQCLGVADQEEEEVADLIAAELLMPVESIYKIVSVQKRISLGIVSQISQKFEVSFKAALRRVADISRIPFLYLNIVPHRFRDLNSYAEIDEAIYVWPGRAIQLQRCSTRFVRRYAFCDIQNAKLKKLCVRGPTGRVLADFEVRTKSRPVPNCDLFTPICGDANWRNEAPRF